MNQIIFSALLIFSRPSSSSCFSALFSMSLRSPSISSSPCPTRPFSGASIPVPRWLLIGLSGAALGLSFPPYPLAPLAWVALVPLLLRWTTVSSAGQMLGEAYVSLLAASVIAFHWVLLHDIRSAAVASAGGLIWFPFLLALPFAASLLFRKRWGLGPGFAVLLVFYLTMEWGLRHGPLALPWFLLSNTQALLDPFRQIADLSGPAILSAWLLTVNGCVLGAVIAGPWPRRVAALAAAGLLVGGAALYGTHRLNEPAPSNRRTEALLIQPALPPGAWSNTAHTARVDTLLRHTENALHGTLPHGVALVVWPETALPPSPNKLAQDALYERLQRWVARNNVTLLTGAIEPASTLAGGAKTYHNAALLIRTDTVQHYRKNYLVPFAEHVPFSEYVPALRAFNVPAGGVAGYERSSQQLPLRAPSFRLGALICLESVFAHHLRTYVSARSTSEPVDFLVTVAQNGWWGPTAGYRQHLAFSQLRAIAVRRAMAFVAVSGGTALIGAQGQRHAYATWMQPATRRVAIPHGTEQSVYVHYGDWISLLAFLSSIGLGGVTLLRYLLNRNASIHD